MYAIKNDVCRFTVSLLKMMSSKEGSLEVIKYIGY